MGRYEVFIKVQNLVRKGITSPSVVMRLANIKQWKTAKSLIDQALKDEYLLLDNAQDEYFGVIANLVYIRNETISDFDVAKDINQRTGLVRNILQINKQLEEMLCFKQLNLSASNKEEKRLRGEAEKRLRQAGII